MIDFYDNGNEKLAFKLPDDCGQVAFTYFIIPTLPVLQGFSVWKFKVNSIKRLKLIKLKIRVKTFN